MEAINQNLTSEFVEMRISSFPKDDKKNTDFSNFTDVSTENLPILKVTHNFSSEIWKKTLTFQAKVIQTTENQVFCDCMIDKENNIFETRVFPKELFEHLNLKEKKMVMIRIQTKPGASRIDIFDGNGIVDETAFEQNNIFDGLENSGLDKPILFEND